jgi:uncharacterized protein (DUF2062 family)
MVYPDGGFRRAIQYVIHRMRRLPDDPRKVARGVFAGCLIGFLPLPGVQFLAAWGLAVVMRGNVLAALLGTFNSNPITTPFFAVMSLSLGHWMLGVESNLTPREVGRGFALAGRDIWHNVVALFTSDVTRWDGLIGFWHDIYLPYFIGALGPALVLSLMFYYLTISLVEAYQHARANKSKERSEKRRKLRATIAEAAARLLPKTDGKGEGDSASAKAPPEPEGGKSPDQS